MLIAADGILALIFGFFIYAGSKGGARDKEDKAKKEREQQEARDRLAQGLPPLAPESAEEKAAKAKQKKRGEMFGALSVVFALWFLGCFIYKTIYGVTWTDALQVSTRA